MGKADFDLSEIASNKPIPLLEHVQRNWPLDQWADSRVVIGVSGGADSVALFCALAELATDSSNLLVVHCNHALRGVESDMDEEFVRVECERTGVALRSFRFNASEVDSTSEESLRKRRLFYLQLAAIEFKASWIALGHHLDDNVETFLHRLVRGTGIRGLQGIPRMRKLSHCENDQTMTLVRPLLTLSKQDILTWLDSRGLRYRTDSSNRDSRYTRNRLRLDLIPLINDIAGSGWQDRVANVIEQLAGLAEERRREIQPLLEALSTQENEVSIPLDRIVSMPWSLQREFFVELFHLRGWPLKRIGNKHWNAIRRLLERAIVSVHPHRLQLPQGMRLVVRKKTITFERSTVV